MYKNWAAISRIEDNILRLILMTMHGEELLKIVSESRPQFFTSEESKPVPRSAIIKKGFDERRQDSINTSASDEELQKEAETDWGIACCYLGIPYVMLSTRVEDGQDADYIHMMPEIEAQLSMHDKPADRLGRILMLYGTRMVVIEANDESLDSLALAPLECIDLRS